MYCVEIFLCLMCFLLWVSYFKNCGGIDWVLFVGLFLINIFWLYVFLLIEFGNEYLVMVLCEFLRILVFKVNNWCILSCLIGWWLSFVKVIGMLKWCWKWWLWVRCFVRVLCFVLILMIWRIVFLCVVNDIDWMLKFFVILWFGWVVCWMNYREVKELSCIS